MPGLDDAVGAAIGPHQMRPRRREVADELEIDSAAANDDQQALEAQDGGKVGSALLHGRRTRSRSGTSRWGAPETELRNTH